MESAEIAVPGYCETHWIRGCGLNGDEVIGCALNGLMMTSGTSRLCDKRFGSTQNGAFW